MKVSRFDYSNTHTIQFVQLIEHEMMQPTKHLHARLNGRMILLENFLVAHNCLKRMWAQRKTRPVKNTTYKHLHDIVLASEFD